MHQGFYVTDSTRNCTIMSLVVLFVIKKSISVTDILIHNELNLLLIKYILKIAFFTEARGDSDAVAKLIADSTERKFKINNIFKGMWKKKHYSFDLS